MGHWSGGSSDGDREHVEALEECHRPLSSTIQTCWVGGNGRRLQLGLQIFDVLKRCMMHVATLQLLFSNHQILGVL